MFVLCINVRIFSSSSRLSSGVVMENILVRFWNDNCECGGNDCVAGGSYWCMKREYGNTIIIHILQRCRFGLNISFVPCSYDYLESILYVMDR